MTEDSQKIWKSILLGLAVTLVLIALKFGFEATESGHELEQYAFRGLQSVVHAVSSEEKLPIVVVDIGKIGKGKNGEPIDFDILKEVISAIAEQKPLAIGIDVLLTPPIYQEPKNDEELKKSSLQNKAYFDVFEHCLELQGEGTPVFLGVGPRTFDAPSSWLGAEKYQSLAATIRIMRNDDHVHLPVWFKNKAYSEKLFSLGASLARSYKSGHLPVLSWFLESDDELPGARKRLDDEVEYLEALADYGRLEMIRETKSSSINAVSVRNEDKKFTGKMVLLGDDLGARDTFNVPGRHETIPGVYLHASAAYTFAKNPMYECKWWVNLLLDLIFSLAVILTVARMRAKKTGLSSKFDWGSFQSKIALYSLAVVLIAAVLLAIFLSIFWLDFLLVAISLWLHPKIEHIITSRFSRA